MKIYFLCLFLMLSACFSREDTGSDGGAGFTLLESDETGIDFRNDLTYTEKLNTYTYRNFYNGAGVALGDINNDGLIDVYICGNQADNKLYLNKGDFRFEDITQKAGVAAAGTWSTGVSMADVNGDGMMDIYVCKSGPPRLSDASVKNERHNQLFINNGDLTFTDKAKPYGVADTGLSTHAAFFDFDKDGDLDMYLLNNSTRPIGAYDLKLGRRQIRDPEGANKLYRNDGRKFTDVSEEAGIFGSAIGYGLGVTVGDVNRDGWQDLFISNDFFERDYLYINNQNGTFREMLEESMSEISMGSMGADMGDIDNDGWPEIYVTEMLPDSLSRIKTKTVFESWDKYQANVRNGYHHQFTRNALQLNNGITPEGEVSFSEVSRITGLEATDWSWGALIFDYNNDMHKDIFVANGIYKDLMDHDYVNFYANNNLFIAKYREDSTVLTNLISKIPSTPIRNYLFSNEGDLKFTDRAEELNLKHKGFSNGAVYGDLDNDGDLDLIINNINDPVSVYRNDVINQGNYIRFELKGAGRNTAAIGTQITVYSGQQSIYQEQAPIKGYLSSVDPRMHFGLGSNEVIDSVVFRWPDDHYSTLIRPKVNQLHQIEEIAQRKSKRLAPEAEEILLHEVAAGKLINYQHEENKFVDFNRNRLAFEMISAEGPHTSIADLNGDDLQDIYISGAKGVAPALLMAKNNGSFISVNEQFWSGESKYEDSQPVFFDADGDGDADLYVGSGSVEYPRNSIWYTDRLYLNDGKGNFKRTKENLPSGMKQSTSFVKAVDFDQDGDLDILTGGRSISAQYGIPVDIYLLENDGKGNFSLSNDPGVEAFKQVGMTKDAALSDLDQDGDMDLIVAGEWMPLTLFINDGDGFHKLEIPNSSGLWNTVIVGDVNNDGKPDILAGNQGLNTRFKASHEKPLTMYVNDFDQNGSIEQMITQYDGEKAYPVNMLQDLVKQMPLLRKKIPTYHSYSKLTMEEIFDREVLERSLEWKVDHLETTLFLNKGNLVFDKSRLPAEIQFSQVHALCLADVTGDGIDDLVAGGNFLRAKPEWGINNASRGQVFEGDGKGGFRYVPADRSGLDVKGEIRSIDAVSMGERTYLLFWRNNKSVKKYLIR